jgi:hypothetical protein
MALYLHTETDWHSPCSGVRKKQQKVHHRVMREAIHPGVAMFPSKSKVKGKVVPVLF